MSYEIKKALPLKQDDVTVIAPSPEKIGTLKWLTSIVITTPSPNVEGKVVIEYVPMTESGELILADENGNNTTKVIVVENLYSCRQQLTELNIAFGAFLSAVQPLESFLSEREKAMTELRTQIRAEALRQESLKQEEDRQREIAQLQSLTEQNAFGSEIIA